MSNRWPSGHNHLFAALAVVPLFVWWLGWYPGFASVDTIDQLGQIQSGEYSNHHPAIHTLYLAALSLGGAYPGGVTLVQMIALGVLLAYGAKLLAKAGVPIWLAVTVGIVLGFSPAVAPTTLALWKDVPFALMLLWAWLELLGLATSDEDRVAPLIRLGAALGGVWLFRGNGPLTVIPVLVVIAWHFRHAWKKTAIAAGATIGMIVVVVGPVYTIADVDRASIEPAQVFLPDLAASYAHDPDTFTPSDIDLLEAVAPLSIWTDRYDCYDSTPLLFDPEFDQTPVRQESGDYRDLEIDVLLRDFDSVARHRACAANFVYAPAQPPDAYFHRPPYDIPPNTVGLGREVKAQWAFDLTDRVWRWAEAESRLWLTWRPAILVLPALLSVVLFALVKSSRPYLLPSTLFVAHTLNVSLTSPAQEFRYAYPLYLMAAMTLTLLWPTVVRLTDSGRFDHATPEGVETLE